MNWPCLYYTQTGLFLENLNLTEIYKTVLCRVHSIESVHYKVERHHRLKY